MVPILYEALEQKENQTKVIFCKEYNQPFSATDASKHYKFSRQEWENAKKYYYYEHDFHFANLLHRKWL